MHIVLLSDHETRGGAAAATSRLAHALCRAGQKVTRIVATQDSQPHPWQTLAMPPSLVARTLQRVFPGQFSQYLLEANAHQHLGKLLSRLRPDVINIHGLHSAASLGWSPALVNICAAYAPLAWTLHDMWSFTGRCAYSDECRKYITGCDDTCPTPTEYPALAPALIAKAWHLRQQLFDNLPSLMGVSPSQWLAREAQAGLWAGHRIEVIPNGLPLHIYRPLGQAQSRQALNINPQSPVLLIAARRFNRHKGGNLFVEAIQQTTERPLTIVVLGQGHLSIRDDKIHLIQLGFVDSEPAKALVYNSADLLVHPAINDNLPNVVMESLACGTPVVGLPIGGLPEMVRPDQTGWLASSNSPTALAEALESALRDKQAFQEMGRRCRRIAEIEYGDTLQAQRYINLFSSLSVQKQDQEIN